MISQRGKKEKREEINCVSLFQKAWGNGGRKFLAKNGIKLFSFSENASLPFFRVILKAVKFEKNIGCSSHFSFTSHANSR